MGSQQFSGSFQKRAWVGADADVSIQEQQAAPPPCAWDAVEDRALQNTCTLASRQPYRRGSNVNAEHRYS